MQQPHFLKDLLAYFTKADISLFHDFAPPPTGGGHQFMRALQQSFTDKGYLTENNTISPTTQACLFNSFNFNPKRLQAKRQRNNTCKMIHRVDGPISIYRGLDDGTDKIVNDWNNKLADVTIFQSHYSMNAYKDLGLTFRHPNIIIPNTPDPTIFNTNQKSTFSPNKKIRLISTSWSDNPNKGLETYKWLDQHIDWNSYEYIFIGRINTNLKNIRHIQPIDSFKIADYLKSSDIYITASRHDPCSNSLLEALACGIPALYLNSGGHGELVQQAGFPFNEPKEIPDLLSQIANDYETYTNRITVPTLNDITQQYLEAMGFNNG